MRRLFAALSLALIVIYPAVAIEAPKGVTLLTVAGNVSESNRGPFDPFVDAFLNFHEKSFEKATTFDLEMLQTLPQVEVTADAEAFPEPVRAKGPLLNDVLSAAGVPKTATVTMLAFDGYAVDFSAEDRAAKNFVLAHSLDGAPMGLGQRGPLWVLTDTGGKKASEDEEATWIWSVFYIEAQ
ncbi:MAG: hypothetical protein AAGC81_18200 [Pseudomonadota bacterium]